MPLELLGLWPNTHESQLQLTAEALVFKTLWKFPQQESECVTCCVYLMSISVSEHDDEHNEPFALVSLSNP